MMNLFKTGLCASTVALLLTGCGDIEPDTSKPEEQEAALASQERSLDACGETETLEEVAEHACIHAENGPFQSVTAAAPGAPVLVDVDLPHTAYHVTLPGTWGHYRGSLHFTPEETTDYAFLLSRHRGLRIFDGNTPVALECRYQVPANVCSTLRTALVAELEEGKTYRLEFGAILTKNAQFTLLVEEAAHGHDHE